MPGRVQRVDDLQRRHRVLGIPLGVVYKFFDDQGGYLASVMSYYAFVAIFPILLIASSVLGFVLQGHPHLQQDILSSALAQFPIVGDQLGRPEGIQGSASAVIVGSLAALYGIIGLGQAAHNAINVVWAIPRNSRLNPVVSRLRGLAWLVLAGVALLLVAVLSSLGGNLDIFGTDLGGGIKWIAAALTVVLTTVVLATMMQLSTPQRERLRDVLPGSLFIAVGWQALQLLGGVYVEHVVKKASQMNAVFATVLGLVALLYIATVIAMLGLEVNVVLTKRLYPRALLTPFTDSVVLTEADKRVYTEYAQAQRHKGFEQIQVSFDDQDP
ncbi:YihY/virulence factor BrkB family protein [Marmoricola sp. URHB0036]|uniref:YihY/virulence factor BrkB family protein n=1 Tax=Marmoricola sp. URHB0036 TaxID=1298863 RepID=UPI001E3C6616|nr:YhjD/YihY/BrkB family envelope integrity protein [Marmoricola sp. URHB0036]